MASIHLQGFLDTTLGDVDVGGVITWTHLTNTGDTIETTKVELIVPPDGFYSIDVNFGQIRIDYTTEFTKRFVAIVVVNGDSTATTIPELLNAFVPPTDGQLLIFQDLLADTVAAKDLAEAAAEQITTTELIGSTATFAPDQVVNTSGFLITGDGGSGKWKQNGQTAQTPSQSPGDLGNALINDGNGNQWAFVALGATLLKEIHIAQMGGKGDGSDDTLAGQATINGCNGGLADFSSGVWDCSDLEVNIAGTVIKGNGYRNSEIRVTVASGNGLIIRDVNWDAAPNGNFINDVQVKDIKISKSVPTTGGAGVKAQLAAELALTNVKINDFAHNLDLQGCQNTRHLNLRLFAGTVNSSLVSGSAFLRIKPAQLTDLSYVAGFTHNFTNFFFGGLATNKVINTAILIQGGEVGWFVNGYLGAVAGQHVLGLPLDDNINMNNYSFDTVYFDGVAGGSGITGVKLIDNAKTGGTAKNWSFANASFGQLKKGFDLAHSLIDNMVIEGKAFNIEEEVILATNDASIKSDLAINGVCTGGGGVACYDLDGVGDITLTGTIKDTNSQTAIRLAGNIDFVSLPALNFRQTGTRLDDSASTITALGDYFGSFTPSINFNGGETGITYSSRSGKYTKTGDAVSFTLSLTLSSKGSDTGNLTFDGLPVASEAVNSAISSRFDNLAATIGDTYLTSHVKESSTEILVERMSGGSRIRLTDGSLTDTSDFVLSGTYQV